MSARTLFDVLASDTAYFDDAVGVDYKTVLSLLCTLDPRVCGEEILWTIAGLVVDIPDEAFTLPQNTLEVATIIRFNMGRDLSTARLSKLLSQLDLGALPGGTFACLQIGNDRYADMRFDGWSRQHVAALGRLVPEVGSCDMISYKAAGHLRDWSQWRDFCAASLYMLVVLVNEGYFETVNEPLQRLVKIAAALPNDVLITFCLVAAGSPKHGISLDDRVAALGEIFKPLPSYVLGWPNDDGHGVDDSDDTDDEEVTYDSWNPYE